MSQPNLNAPKYRRVIEAALRQPWCVTPEMRAIIFELLRFRAQGGRLTPEEIKARIGDDDEDETSPRRVMRTLRPPNGGQGSAVTIVPVYGVIAHRTFQASSGMTSTEMISAMFKRALADVETSTILLDVSSPGGGVEGVPELAAEIFQGKGRGSKHIVAIANNLAASAAYWLASQADELIVIPSGQVGSIGVFSLHEDWSGWLEKEGVKVTALSAGEKKLEGAPWEPLDAEAKAHFQGQVDEVYAEFIKAVAKGRGVSQAKVKSDFGQGRVFTANEALKRGMVDGIATFDETVSRLLAQKGRRRAVVAVSEGSTKVALDFGSTEPAADPANAVMQAQADPEPEPEPEPEDVLDLVGARMRMATELDAER